MDMSSDNDWEQISKWESLSTPLLVRFVCGDSSLAGDELLLSFSGRGLRSLKYPFGMYEVDEKPQLTFDVGFGEPEVVEGKSALETLIQTLDYVDNLILSFKPLLV